MDAGELMRIVREENLETPVLYGAGMLRAEVVVLDKDASGWKVYVADERGGATGSTLATFDDESDALEHVLSKVRQGTKYHRALEAKARAKHPPGSSASAG